jgi:hypothetical protein
MGNDIGKKPKITYIGNGNVSSSAKTGHSTPKEAKQAAEKETKTEEETTTPADYTEKDEIVERYKEVDD